MKSATLDNIDRVTFMDIVTLVAAATPRKES
jgi:hypothetical protein